MHVIWCKYVVCRVSTHRLRTTGLDTHLTNKEDKEQLGEYLFTKYSHCFECQTRAMNILVSSYLGKFSHWAWADILVGRCTDSFRLCFYTHVGKYLCFDIHQYLFRKKTECIVMPNASRICDTAISTSGRHKTETFVAGSTSMVLKVLSAIICQVCF